MDERIVSFFTEGRNFVHLATLLPDGSPHSIPVWAIYEDGRIAFFTQSASRNAQIRGRVVEVIEGEPALG